MFIIYISKFSSSTYPSVVPQLNTGFVSIGPMCLCFCASLWLTAVFSGCPASASFSVQSLLPLLPIHPLDSLLFDILWFCHRPDHSYYMCIIALLSRPSWDLQFHLLDDKYIFCIDYLFIVSSCLHGWDTGWNEQLHEDSEPWSTKSMDLIVQN